MEGEKKVNYYFAIKTSSKLRLNVIDDATYRGVTYNIRAPICHAAQQFPQLFLKDSLRKTNIELHNNYFSLFILFTRGGEVNEGPSEMEQVVRELGISFGKMKSLCI